MPAFDMTLRGLTQATMPGGWNLASAVGGSPLGVPVDARIPRAVSIDVDLTAVPVNHRVLFVAVTGSGADALTAPVTGNPATISDLVRAWPHVAMRLVRVANRPA